MSVTLVVLLTAAGFLTALLSGMTGLGGGTVLIAVMYTAGLPPATAVPLFAAVQTLSNASRTLAYFRDVDWRAAGWFVLGTAPTPFLFAPLVANASADPLRVILALLILASLAAERQGLRPLPPRLAYFLGGVINGSIGMFVGATGLFLGRLYIRPDWSKQRIVATLAMTQALGHVFKVLGFASAGATASLQASVLVPVGVAVIAGTFAGRQLHNLLDEARFRQVFKGLLVVLAIKLLWDGGRGLLGPLWG